jgi:NADPH2:quinone reductase
MQISQFGGPEVLTLVDVERPEPGVGEARIRVEVAGVNFIEAHMRAGAFPLPLPTILGGEVVGIVEALGPGASGTDLGDRVAAPLFLAGGFGGYAEYAVLNTAMLVKLPADVPAAAASALMSQGYTAFHLARLFPAEGKTVFVHAAAGALGSLLIQLLKRQGARTVIAGAGADKHGLARALGADVAVDYRQPGWADAVRAANPEGVDIIFDAAGGEVSQTGLGLLGPGGRLVAFGAPTLATLSIGPAELGAMSAQNQSLHAFSLMPLLTTHGLGRTMAELIALVQAGDLHVEIGGAYPLADAARAHDDLEQRRTSGKVVLTL